VRALAVSLCLVIGCGSPEPARTAAPAPAPADDETAPADGCEEGHECRCDGCAGTPRVAMCEQGRCETVDLRVHPLSACSADTDCVVLHRDCCACEEGFVSVRDGSEGEYYDRTCGETPICSPCERHDVPDTLAGRCVDGHCEVATVERAPPSCPPGCAPVDEPRCHPDREPCTCGAIHQPFADCEPSPSRPCPSARAFTVACDPRCCD